jgi:hypothetical protein
MPQEVWEQYKMLKNSLDNGTTDEYFDSFRYTDRGGA